MSASQPNKTGLTPMPQPVVFADDALHDPRCDEPPLVKLYMELTGENESQARNVFMFVNHDNGESSARPPD